MCIDKLQADLEDHDSRNWLHEPGFETDTHNFLHVAKTAGKIAAHLENIDDQRIPSDRQLDPMVVADLAIEALRFANNTGYSLQGAIEQRLEQLRERALGSNPQD